MFSSSKSLKIFEKDNLEKAVSNFPISFYAPKLTAKEVIEDAEDIDLGLPPKNRTLDSEGKKKRIEEETFQLKNFTQKFDPIFTMPVRMN